MKKLIIILLVCFILSLGLSIADVGNFESYEYDDNHSSWDYSSSDYSNWNLYEDYNNDYDVSPSRDKIEKNSTASFKEYTMEEKIKIFIAILFVLLFISSFAIVPWIVHISRHKKSIYISPEKSGYPQNYLRNTEQSNRVELKLKEYDKTFDKNKFITYVKKVFIELQNAWSERNWEVIRTIESETLFEMHAKQLQEYINRGLINKIENVSVNYIDLSDYSNEHGNETLVVLLNSTMTDYITDSDNNIVKGSISRRITNMYKLTFVRKKKLENIVYEDFIQKINCPNCGALTKINSSGKCEYCGSIITSSQHDWVLNDMERC